MAEYVDVVIEGIRPLLQHRFSEASEAALSEKTRKVVVKDQPARQQAMEQAYYDNDGVFYIPEDYLLGTLSNVGANHRIKGVRRTAKFLVPAAIECTDERLPLLDFDDNPIVHCEIDSRPVNNVKVKARVMCHRPRFNEWRVAFTLMIEDSVIPVSLVHTMLQEAGVQAGIGSYRPKFGRFVVVEWKPRSRSSNMRKLDTSLDNPKIASVAHEIGDMLKEEIENLQEGDVDVDVDVDIKIDPRAIPATRRGRPKGSKNKR